MMLGLQGGFANTWDSAPVSSAALFALNNSANLQPSTTTGTVGVVTHLPGTQSVTMSNFGGTVLGVTTVGVVKGLTTAFPVVVNADFSCWVPNLGIFVAPEQTNLMQKLSE